MGLLTSLFNKIKNKKNDILIQKIITSKNKIDILFSLEPKELTTEMLEIAILTANNEEEKTNILSLVRPEHIRESKCAEFIIEVLRYNPQKFNLLNYDYWTTPEHEDEYIRILIDLGQELNSRICGYNLRSQYLTDSEKLKKQICVSILNNIKESLDKAQEIVDPSNKIDTSTI